MLTATTTAASTSDQEPTPVPSAVTVTIDDDGNPLVETVEDNGNPLAGGASGTWSLFNLLCTILVVVLGAWMLVGMFGRKRDDDEERNEREGAAMQAEAQDARSAGESDEPERTDKRRRLLRGLGVIPAVVAVVACLLTQDMTQTMALFDSWSILFGVLALVEIGLFIASIRRKTGDDGNEPQPQQEGYSPSVA